MTTETKLRGGLAMSLLALITMTFFYFQQQDELQRCKAGNSFLQGGDIQSANEIDSVSAIADSLRDELFIERVDAGRHEISREEILNKYPKVKKEYEDFYSHQTE
jgi:hypothetical protein